MWCLACQHCSSGLHNFLDQKALDCLLVHVQTDLRGVKLHRLNQEGLSCLLQLWVYIIHYHKGGTEPGGGGGTGSQPEVNIGVISKKLHRFCIPLETVCNKMYHISGSRYSTMTWNIAIL